MELSQGTPISIKLRTKVKQQGEVQDFYFDLKGQMVTIGDTLYIRYKEMQEETGDEIPVTIKLVPDGHVQLIRAGDPDCYLYERTACKFERPSHSRKGSDRL